MPQSIGQPVRRKEDLRLVTGPAATATTSTCPARHAHVLRSLHAHARIRGIDTAAARAMPGVLAVLTGADVGPMGSSRSRTRRSRSKPPADILLTNRKARPHGDAPQALLPSDRVRYVGQQVVLVVAESVAAAKDAAERVTWITRCCTAVDEAAAAAEPMRRGSTTTPATSASTPMSAMSRRPRPRSRAPRKCEARYLGASRHRRAARRARRGRRLRSGGEQIHSACRHRRRGAAEGRACQRSSASPPDRAGRVRRRRRQFRHAERLLPEFALVVWAAKRLGRPVKWTCERSRHSSATTRAATRSIQAELALDDKGKFLAMRGSIICNTGAHSVMFVPLVKCA